MLINDVLPKMSKINSRFTIFKSIKHLLMLLPKIMTLRNQSDFVSLRTQQHSTSNHIVIWTEEITSEQFNRRLAKGKTLPELIVIDNQHA